MAHSALGYSPRTRRQRVARARSPSFRYQPSASWTHNASPRTTTMKGVLWNTGLWLGTMLASGAAAALFGATAGGFVAMLGLVVIGAYHIGTALYQDAL